MPSRRLSRREFIKGASALMISPLLVSNLRAQTGMRERLDWNTFRNTRDYASLVEGIARMKQNTNASDKRSWTYWVNAHQSFCPHGLPYFFAWHRGYLYYFEQQLRAVSGNNALVLPYWDYYTTPQMPAEFTNPASYNSLYVPRLNTNVNSTLTLVPFSNTITNFQRGLPNAFEPSFEGAPHDPIHNLIGNSMASLLSPTDPIFWVHHANVDRLWSAWTQAGGGRTMPASTNSYWNGIFTYATALTIQRTRVISTRNDMGYFYTNELMPTSLPVAGAAQTNDLRLVSLTPDQKLAQMGPPTSSGRPRLVKRPDVVKFKKSEAKDKGGNRRSLGGVLDIPLDESSISVELSIDSSSSQLLQGVLNPGNQPNASGPAPHAAGSPYRSVQLVLDSVSLRGDGHLGGYFYRIYVNLPSSTDVETAGESYQIGAIGPYEISGAEHRVHMNMEPSGSEPGTVRMVFPATLLLRKLLSGPPSGLTISIIRISGETTPAGDVIRIGEMRLELSLDPIQ
jgi:tyrosinase